MRRMGKTGQSMAEYAVLLGIAIGVAVAAQQFMKPRMENAIAWHMNDFETTAGVTGVADKTKLKRKTASESATDVTMDNATDGKVRSVGGSTSGVKK